jgi:hypothetical protein
MGAMAMHPDFERSVPKGNLPVLFPGGIEEVLPERKPVRATTVHSFLSRRNRSKRLFNALAAALDQDDQNNNRKDGGNYANKCYSVHLNSPFLFKIFVKTLHYGDSRWTQSHQKQGGKYKKYKREDKFDGCLCCLLLHLLATLGSEGVRMNS